MDLIEKIEIEVEGRIRIGDYEIIDLEMFGHTWIRRICGEGMSVKKEVLYKLIDDFYNENF